MIQKLKLQYLYIMSSNLKFSVKIMKTVVFTILKARDIKVNNQLSFLQLYGCKKLYKSEKYGKSQQKKL